MKNNDRVNIGIVGVGIYGEAHLATFQKVPGVNVIAICDTDKNRLSNIQKTYHVHNAYTSIDDMVTNVQLDGVVIATPDHLHREPTEIIAKAEIPILLEKPLATTIEDANQIAHVIEQNGSKLLMGFTISWIPEIQYLKKSIQEGDLGIITNIYTRRLCRKTTAERFKGRCSINQYLGSHDIYLMLWILGPNIDSVYAVKGDFDISKQFGTADFYWNILRWENGAIGAAHVSWSEPTSHLDSKVYVGENEIMINGTKGSARLSRPSKHLTYYLESKSMTVDLSNYRFIQAQYFIDCIKNRQPYYPSVREGLNVMKIIEAAEKSIEESSPIKISLDDE